MFGPGDAAQSTGSDDPAARVAALNEAASALLKTDEAGALSLAQTAACLAGTHDVAGLARAQLIQGSVHTRRGESEQALEQLHGALQLFRAAEHPAGERDALTALGRLGMRLGDFGVARDHLAAALSLTGQQSAEAAQILNLLAGSHHASGEYAQALSHLHRARQIHELLGDQREVASVLGNMGTLHTSLGNYPDALAHLSEAYRIFRDSLGDERMQAMALINLGTVHLDMGEFTRAARYFEEALGIAVQRGDRLTIATAKLNIAEAWTGNRDPERAEAAYTEALDTARQIQYRTGEVSALIGLGRLLAQRGELTEAATAHAEAVAIAREIEDLEGELDALNHLGEVQAERGDLPAALASLERALTLAQDADHKKTVYEAHRALAEVHKRAGDFRRALHHHELYHQAERALFNEESDRKTRELGAQFEVERARHETEVQRLQRELADTAREEAEALVQARTAELEQAQVEIVTRLAVAAEYRDDMTGEHTWRVGHVSALIARDLGLPEEDVALLRIAARLHDVGKIGIPDAILLKPGRFTPAEFERMKVHTLIGARILSGGHSRLLRMAEEIALSHHERWDGGGYPLGQAGHSIPLTGRIVAVADVFDALTNERPYKSAWTRAQALAELQRQAGQQFDPEVVAAGLRVFSRVEGPITPR